MQIFGLAIKVFQSLAVVDPVWLLLIQFQSYPSVAAVESLGESGPKSLGNGEGLQKKAVSQMCVPNRQWFCSHKRMEMGWKKNLKGVTEKNQRDAGSTP